ncbi:hypothetical protein SEA_ATUIN_330 [Arthrobacter phage Atuin]|nr:hypothetical protein SEA_ATUIN_129 [Arthrobacter phage Atuin]
MIQIKTIKILHGRVLAEELSDKLATVDYLDAVRTVQQNARGALRDLRGILDTPDGVIKTDRQGYIEIYSVRVILD